MSTIPSSQASLKKILSGFTIALDQLDWSIAAVLFAWTTDEAGEDIPRERGVVSSFGIRGFSQAVKIKAYQDAYRLAVKEGVVPFLGKGDAISVPSTSFDNYYGKTTFRQKQIDRQNPTPSIVGERDTTSDPKNSTTLKPQPDARRQDSGPRVATLEDRAVRALQEVRSSIKQESDPMRKLQWQLAQAQLENVVRLYQKQSVAA